MKQIIYIILILLFFSCSTQISFDSYNWKKAQNRKAMVEDLDNLLDSQTYTYSEIIELLGEPDLGRNDSIAYHIESGFGLEVNLLTINFEKELVKSHDIGYHD